MTNPFMPIRKNDAAVKRFKIFLHEDKNASLEPGEVAVRTKLMAQLLDAAK